MITYTVLNRDGHAVGTIACRDGLCFPSLPGSSPIKKMADAAHLFVPRGIVVMKGYYVTVGVKVQHVQALIACYEATKTV